MLTNLFIALGFTRDDVSWVVAKVLALATLIASGALDLVYWANYLGVPLTLVGLHWIQVIAAVILWVSASNSSSKLPGK
jgi:hypothetical protein